MKEESIKYIFYKFINCIIGEVNYAYFITSSWQLMKKTLRKVV